MALARAEKLLSRSGMSGGGRRTAHAAVEIDGRTIPLAVSWHERARRFTLRLDPRTGGAKLTVPAHADLDEAVAFLERHEGWLAREQARIAEPVPLCPGALIPLRGKPHELRLDGRSGGRVRAGVEDGQAVLVVAGTADMMAIRALRWLKAQARADLDARVRHHAARIGVVSGRISLRDQRTRWGSCSQSGGLSFSWRLILAPPEVLDYVAAHEVAHLKEMNHGPRFWRLLRCTEFDLDQARRWLSRNGQGLHRYGGAAPVNLAASADRT